MPRFILLDTERDRMYKGKSLHELEEKFHSLNKNSNPIPPQYQKPWWDVDFEWDMHRS